MSDGMHGEWGGKARTIEGLKALVRIKVLYTQRHYGYQARLDLFNTDELDGTGATISQAIDDLHIKVNVLVSNINSIKWSEAIETDGYWECENDENI